MGRRRSSTVSLPLKVSPLPRTQPDVGPFRMTWQKVCEQVESLDFGAIGRRLDVSHEYLWDCFRASLTGTGWNLFDPREVE